MQTPAPLVLACFVDTHGCARPASLVMYGVMQVQHINDVSVFRCSQDTQDAEACAGSRRDLSTSTPHRSLTDQALYRGYSGSRLRPDIRASSTYVPVRCRPVRAYCFSDMEVSRCSVSQQREAGLCRATSKSMTPISNAEAHTLLFHR